MGRGSVPDLPQPLSGEDRSYGSGLFVDLVPRSCWFTNAWSCTAPRNWERLRRIVMVRAGSQSEACQQGTDRPVRRWLEVHKRRSYLEETSIQRLRRLLCLCTDCHRVTHLGLAGVEKMAAEARAHLQAVAGMSERQVETPGIPFVEAVWRWDLQRSCPDSPASSAPATPPGWPPSRA
jgi:hypothetical protein